MFDISDLTVDYLTYCLNDAIKSMEATDAAIHRTILAVGDCSVGKGEGDLHRFKCKFRFGDYYIYRQKEGKRLWIARKEGGAWKDHFCNVDLEKLVTGLVIQAEGETT